MAFQSKDALGGDFSRAFNRQMNSKRRMRAVSFVGPEGRDFPQRFRRTRSRVQDSRFVPALVEFIPRTRRLSQSDSLESRKICFIANAVLVADNFRSRTRTRG